MSMGKSTELIAKVLAPKTLQKKMRLKNSIEIVASSLLRRKKVSKVVIEMFLFKS